MSIYNQIQSIYQIGNMLVYNGKNILLDGRTAYETLQTYLTARELELLNQHITDYFYGDVAEYNKHLIATGRDKLAGYDFAVVAKEHGLDIYVRTVKDIVKSREKAQEISRAESKKFYH